MNLAAMGAVGAAVAAAWGTIKSYLGRLYGVFVVRITFTNYLMTDAMRVYLKRNFKASNFNVKMFTGRSKYVRPEQRNQLVAFELIIPSDTKIIFRKKLRFMSVNQTEVRYIRGTFNTEQLIKDIVEIYNELSSSTSTASRYYVKKIYGSIGQKNLKQTAKGLMAGDSPEAPTLEDEGSINLKYKSHVIGWSEEGIGQPQRKGAVDQLALSDDALDAVESARSWRGHEQWYKSRFIPWKRGWLLHGPPGTGKTALVRAMAQDLNMPIVMYDLASMTNKDLGEAWNNMMYHTPCVALFEDIDGVFEGRKNIAVHGMENGLTFNAFLNTIDGVENTDGAFIIITTNNLEHVDSAIGIPNNGGHISTRPGRVDRAVELGIIDKPGRMKLAKRIFGGYPIDQWECLVNDDTPYTPAQFQELCAGRALELLWEQDDKP